jgi:antitoxin ParD1/3/4
MQVSLSPRLWKIIQGQVESGRFATPEEVIAAGVGVIQTTTELPSEDIAELRALAQVGLEQANRGEFVEFNAEEVIAEGRVILSKSKKQKAG